MTLEQLGQMLALGVALALPIGCAFDTGGTELTTQTDTESGSTSDLQQPVSTYGAYGWVLNTVPGANSTPSSDNSFNTAGGVNKIYRASLGHYTVDFPKLQTQLNAPRGFAMVTPFTFAVFSAPTPEHCSLQDWGPIAGAIRVFVNCFKPNGDYADSMFTLSYFDPSITDRGAYAVFGNSGITADKSWNSSGATNTVTHGAPNSGQYTVAFPGVATTAERGSVQVAATVGAAREYCKVRSFSVSGTTAIVGVSCFTFDGAAVDTGVAVLYTRSGVESPGAGGYLRADQPSIATTAPYTPSTAFSYNSLEAISDTPVTPKASRAGLGVYSAIYPRMPSTNRVATHATAFGTNKNYCKVGITLNDTATSGALSMVYCFNAAGTLADSEYMHTYLFDKVIVF